MVASLFQTTGPVKAALAHGMLDSSGPRAVMGLFGETTAKQSEGHMKCTWSTPGTASRGSKRSS